MSSPSSRGESHSTAGPKDIEGSTLDIDCKADGLAPRGAGWTVFTDDRISLQAIARVSLAFQQGGDRLRRGGLPGRRYAECVLRANDLSNVSPATGCE